jgi:peptidoglycan/xylan/chitin deacetylase (PgdA/CDA1 family)
MTLSLFTLAALCASARSQTQRQVAITVDDLPYTTGADCDEQETLSLTEKFLKPLHEARVPVVGFVVGVRCSNLSREQKSRLFQMWLDEGGELGNHTWSHPDLNKVSLQQYAQEISTLEEELHRTIPSLTIKYFRAPYLHDGATPEIKEQLQSFLKQHGYTEAPVTLDNNDWVFAAAYNRALQEGKRALANQIIKAYIPYMKSIVAFFENRSREVFGRECSQVLLIHASKLNASVVPQLLQMFTSRGYAFVTLDQAMRDNCYETPDARRTPACSIFCNHCWR